MTEDTHLAIDVTLAKDCVSLMNTERKSLKFHNQLISYRQVKMIINNIHVEKNFFLSNIFSLKMFLLL